MNVVLVTGVTGFIGRYIARQFAEAGWSVVGLGTRPAENAPTQYLFRYQQIILPSSELAVLIKELQPQVCIHCAARASVPLSMTQPDTDFHNGVVVTFDLLNTLRLHAPDCRTIYISSAAVYGNPESLPIRESHSVNPISPYGYHKLIGEKLCQEFFKIYGLPTAVARIFSAYGPGLRRQVLWDICYKALTQDIVKLQGTGDESRDFIHVRDVAKAIQIMAENAPCQAEIYNLANGTETTIKELTSLILKYLDSNVSAVFDGIVSVSNPLNWKADISQIQQLRYTPEVPFERGVQIYSQWCRAEVLGW